MSLSIAASELIKMDHSITYNFNPTAKTSVPTVTIDILKKGQVTVVDDIG